MAKKRITAYWLLLLTLLFTAGLTLSVGESQARYNNTVGASIMVHSQQSGVTSNCLVTSNDPAVTVLAGELSLYNTKSVTFWLHSSGEGATGALRWGVADPEHAKYVKVTMQSGADVIDPEAEIELLEDVNMDITMNIMTTETARNTVHEEMKIQILVTWGESMWGTFQVILPAVESEEEPTEPTEPATPTEPAAPPTEPSVEVTVPATTPTEPAITPTEPSVDPAELDTTPTEPSGEATEPSTEATEPTDAATEPSTVSAELLTASDEASATAVEPSTEAAEPSTEATEPSTEATEPSTEATEPSSEATEPSTEATEPSTEATEPSTEATEPSTEATEPSTEATEPSTEATEPPTEATEPTIPDEEEDPDPIRMETLSRFDPTGKLPIHLALTEEITTVRLGLGTIQDQDAEDPEMPRAEVQPLPNYTRFSLDGGESYYMLYPGCVAELTVNKLTSLPVLLDLQHTGMEYGTSFLVAMDAYAGDRLVENNYEKTICGSTDPVKLEVYEKEAYEKSLMNAEAAQAEEDTAEEQVKSKNSHILNQDTVLVMTLPKEWQETDMEYTVELLTRAEEDQKLYYKRVDPEAEGIAIELRDNEAQYEMLLTIGNRLPQAGTYRVNMQWKYEGICYVKKQTTFFINYAAHTGYSLGGLEVSNDD